MEIFNREYKVKAKDLIEDLAKVFKFKGLDYGHVKGQAFLCCPFHSNGQERTASANFSLVNKGRAREGDFYCFGCKTSGHISSILVKLFNSKEMAVKWIEGKYGNLRGLVEEQRPRELRKLSLPQQEEPVEKTKQVFELNERAYVVETTYYEKRGIPGELVERFKLGYIDNTDENRRRVYMPVFDSVGDVVFYMTRNIHNKQFYLPEGAHKVLWAANEINTPEVVVCESIFNALTCWKYGRPAVAMFGTGFEGVIEQLLALNCRHYILALDNDVAGIKGIKEIGGALLKASKLISTVFINEPKKDLNDFAHLSQEEFDMKWQQWLHRGIYSG